MARPEIDPALFEEPDSRKRSTEHWTILGLSLLVPLGLVFLGFFLEPDARGYGTHESLGLEPCYPLVAWNFPCPGCGVTTALTHAARGDLLAALVVQPFGCFLAVGGVCFAMWALWSHRRGRDVWIEINTRGWLRWWAPTLVLLLLSWGYKIGRVRGWF